MEKLEKYFLTVGIFFVVGGLFSGLGGVLRMIRFFREMSDWDSITVTQLSRGVIIPHVLMLTGMGILIYGSILLVKGIIFRRNASARQRGDAGRNFRKGDS